MSVSIDEELEKAANRQGNLLSRRLPSGCL